MTMAVKLGHFVLRQVYLTGLRLNNSYNLLDISFIFRCMWFTTSAHINYKPQTLLNDNNVDLQLCVHI